MLTVNIRSRKKSFYEGKADSVTSLNDKGEFDVLAQHANFISIISNYVILNKNTKEEKKFVITSGVLRVKADIVDIFLDV